MQITAELLATHGACADQVAIVAREWPMGAEPTEAALLRAVELGLTIQWLRVFLPAPLRAECDRRAVEYDRQAAALLAGYNRQAVALWAEYARQAAALWAEYRRQAAALWVEYDRQAAALLAGYDRQAAPLLARLFGSL